MYVFGGGDAKYWLNDLDMLNLSKNCHHQSSSLSSSIIINLLGTLQWNKCETKGTPPAGRLQHSAVAYG